MQPPSFSYARWRQLQTLETFGWPKREGERERVNGSFLQPPPDVVVGRLKVRKSQSTQIKVGDFLRVKTIRERGGKLPLQADNQSHSLSFQQRRSTLVLSSPFPPRATPAAAWREEGSTVSQSTAGSEFVIKFEIFGLH